MFKFIYFISILLTSVTVSMTAFSQEKIIAVVLNLSQHPMAQVESITIKNSLDKFFNKETHALSKKNYKIHYYNDNGKINDAIRIAKKLNQDSRIKLVLGGYSSLTAIPMSQTLKKNFINIFASSEKAIRNSPHQIQLVGNNKIHAQKIAHFIHHTLKKKNPCLLIESTDGFSVSIKRELEIQFHHLKIPHTHFSYPEQDDLEIQNLLDSCYLTHPDVLIHSGRSFAAKIIINHHLKHHPTIPFIGSDGWGGLKLIFSGENSHLLTKLKPPLFLSYYWNQHPQNPIQQQLIETQHQQSHPPLGALDLLGQDAALLALSFVNSSHSTLHEWLKKEYQKPSFALLNHQGQFQIIPKIYSITPSGHLE